MKKIPLLLISFISLIVSLELALRFYGFLHRLPQARENSRKIDASGKKIYKILLLGESTTAYPTSKWSSKLETILNNSGVGYRFKVINEGVPGTNTTFIAVRLEENLAKYRPDMVVTMMGINDSISFLKYWEKNWLGRQIGGLRVVKLINWVSFSLKNGSLSSFTGKNSRFGQSNNLVDQTKVLFAQEKFQEAIALAEYALKIAPSNRRAMLALGEMYLIEGNLEKSGEIYRLASGNLTGSQVLGLTVSDDSLSPPLRVFGDEEGISKSEEERRYTKENYKKIAGILRKEGVKYIAMQYPTLDINEVKDLLDYDRSVIYVANLENFAAALKQYEYEDLFTDDIRATFGHTTELGDSLIAENLAPIILEQLGERGLE